MRKVAAMMAVLVGVAWFWTVSSPSRVSAQGQAVQAGITIGERIRLRFEPDKNSYDCTVMDVRGDFVGCKRPDSGFGTTGPDRWYNLKLVALVERPLQPQ